MRCSTCVRMTVERSYKYEMLDLREDDTMTDMECHFGLVRTDGSVKPSFTAIRNLLRVLSDDDGADCRCRPLDYAVEAPEGVTIRTTLLQKSDGRWFLALMRECEAYDLKRLTDDSTQIRYATVCSQRVGRSCCRLRPYGSCDGASGCRGAAHRGRPENKVVRLAEGMMCEKSVPKGMVSKRWRER